MRLVADECYVCGMTRIRISTTVDEATLLAGRELGLGNDATMIDAALAALIATHRAAEIDKSYEAYDRVPLDTPDEWGDLESFVQSVDRATRRPEPRDAAQG